MVRKRLQKKKGQKTALKTEKALKIKNFCVRVQNYCTIMAPPAGLVQQKAAGGRFLQAVSAKVQVLK